MDNKNAADLLQEGAKLFKKKNIDYGNSYYQSGKIFDVLFPDGLLLKNSVDFSKFALIGNIVTKLVRYGNLFGKDSKFESKEDSVRDLGVYSFMLLELELNDMKDRKNK